MSDLDTLPPAEPEPTDLDAANARADAAEHRAVRAEVAAAKGVPVDLIHGTTREELEAHADAVLAFAQTDQSEKPRWNLHLPNADRVPNKIPHDNAEFVSDLFGGGL